MNTKLIEQRIQEFNTFYAHYTERELTDEDYNSKWTSEFFQMPGTDLFALITAAQEGSYTLLIHTVARRIAEIIEEKSLEELREHFDLLDDLTNKEKAELRKEY